MMKSSLVCIAVALSVFVTGCASTDSGSVNPNLKKDEPKFFSKSGGSACLIGATIAGLACLGIKDDNKAAACLIAATAGCAAGMTANYMLDKTRANYHNLEDQLDASKKQVQDSINSTRTLKETSEQTLADDRAEVESIKANIKAGTASKADLEKKLSDMEANLAYMRKRLDSDKSTLNEYRSLRDSLDRGEGGKPATNSRVAERKAEELDNEIERLEQNIYELENSISSYAQQTSIVKGDVSQISI